jgi:16S rRNA (cytosine967-C5)-methyltransferase
MDNCREIALNTLMLVLENGAYSNIALNNEINKSNLTDKDKALLTELVYGTIKNKYSIDIFLSKFVTNGIEHIEPILLNILRIAIFQINYLDKIPEFAAVNEAVQLAKTKKSIGASKLVNGVLRNFLRKKGELNFEGSNDVNTLAFKYSFEPWMVELFLNQYGKELTVKILNGLNCTPFLTVRVNTNKSDPQAVSEMLISKGYNIEKGQICSEAIYIIKGRGLENNQLFNEGFITVQDESAMLVAHALELESLKEEKTILDLCSAPGGKTTHISEVLDNTGSIYAFDKTNQKLSLIKTNYDRLGLSNINLDIMDSEMLNDKYINFADRVLIDVPCSGMGIIRKKPEIKWAKNIKDINNIIIIQRKIMKNAAKYVKKDGILVYSTCTLNKEENEENVKWFLKKNKEYILEPVFFGNFDNVIYNKDGYVTIIPNNYMDGFFIAKFRKTS